MPDAKSIYQVQVDDAGFKRFQALFTKYQEQLAKVPKAWQDIAEAQAAATPKTKMDTNLDAMEQTVEKMNKNLGQTSTKIGSADIAAQKFGRTMRSIGSVTSDIAKSIAGMALGLAGFGAIGLGAPLWLMDRLGQSASAMAVTAGGINSKPGSVQAFNSSFARVGADTSMLSQLANAQQDPGLAAKLSVATGLPYDQISNMDTSQLAIALMTRERTMMKGKPRQSWGPLLNAYGFSAAGITPQIANNLNSESDAQFNSNVSSFQSQSKQLNSMTNSGTMTEWQNFTQRMTEAGNKIEDVFIKGLAPLAGPLSDLSKAFSDAAVAFFKSGKLNQWITQFSAGLEVIAQEVGTKDFQDKITQFADDVGTLVLDLGKLTKAFAGFLKVVPDTGSAIKNFFSGFGAGNSLMLPEAYRTSGGSQFGPATITNASWNMGVPGGGNGKWGALDASSGLPSGFLEAVENQESGGNPFALSRAGAQGAFQFMPSTAAKYGLSNPFDENASAVAASQYFKNLMVMFGGNTQEALAGYNWGEGNVQKAVSKYGTDWLSHAPVETQNYVANIMSKLAGGSGGGVKIIINNNTGGSATVSTAALTV